MRRRRRWLWITAVAFLMLMIALLVWAAWPGRSSFTVGPETTYVNGPLDEHGYVDYGKELNERLGKGVTPENNANVLIWQALGPQPISVVMAGEYFKWLGIDPPPEQGDFFVYSAYYLEKKHGQRADPQLRNDFRNRLERACKRPWTAKQDPELSEWLKQNEKPLALFIEASRRPGYYNPLIMQRSDDWQPSLFWAALPSVSVCKEAISALTCRAMLRVADGRFDEAWQDLLACHRLSRHLTHGGTLVELWLGAETDRAACAADLVFLDRAGLSSQQIMNCSDELRHLRPFGSIAEKIDVGFRFMFLQSVMFLSGQRTERLKGELASYRTPSKDAGTAEKLFTRSVDWDLAMQNINRFCDRCIAASGLADRAARQQAISAIEDESRAAANEVADTGFFERFLSSPASRGEEIINMLIGFVFPKFGNMLTGAQSSIDQGEQSYRNLQLAFALAAFHADTGHYPAKLDELAPKYLDKIPSDLFSDKPLIYKPDGNGYLLYSVGPNGVDDAGKTQDDDPKGDDIVVHMPVPPPREKK